MDVNDLLKRMNGSFFQGENKDGYPTGQGTYTFANGTVYTGTFSEGMFNGEGTLAFPKGGKFIATWSLGKLIKGTYYFDDELEYEPKDWKYATDADRRFWTEIQNGISLGDMPQLTDRTPSMWIPKGTYDIGEG